MGSRALVVGLLDTSARVAAPSVTRKCRDLTIAWSRYDYHDRIIEGGSVHEILSEACRGDHRFCLIQSYGHIIQEGFLPALVSWAERQEFVVAGYIQKAQDSWYGLDPCCILVDLDAFRARAPRPDRRPPQAIALPASREEMSNGRIRALHPAPGRFPGRPGLPGWNLIDMSLSNDVPVLGFPEHVASAALNLEPGDKNRSDALSRYLGEGIDDYRVGGGEASGLAKDQAMFLDGVARQAAGARRGVFLWNKESYADIETPLDETPLSRLYSVAAGFKPNRILLTHGFVHNTSVVFFDYSERALQVRKEMLSHWDGDDFPHFVQHLFRKFRTARIFYQDWPDLSGESISATAIEQAWRDELLCWGGEAAFRDHWRFYRELEHEFLHCDVFADADLLIQSMRGQANPAIWFSNAFFTVYANWYYDLGQRRERYESFIARAADANPRLLLYGSDHNNTNVNWIRARDYWSRYSATVGTELNPTRLGRHEIRM